MWFWLAMGAAVFGAIDVILNKHLLDKVSAVVLTWSIFTLSIPFLTPYFLKISQQNIPGSQQQ